MATMDDNSIMVHELMLSYQRAGFTESQALELVKIHLEAALVTDHCDTCRGKL
jgi:hypothetical protein